MGVDASVTSPQSCSPVAVLMPVFKPHAPYLKAQMQSIKAQLQSKVRLYCIVADHVSAEQISRIASEVGLSVSLIHPDRPLKVTAAIALGLERAVKDGGFDYLAFCDQDDVWLPDKLHQQVQILIEEGAGLTYSDALVVDADNQRVLGRMHALERRPRVPSLLNLALGNIGTGMTMLMTRDFAAALLTVIVADNNEMLHDYQAMVLGVNLEEVFFDERAWVRYRQHDSNQVGLSWGSKLWRKINMIRLSANEGTARRMSESSPDQRVSVKSLLAFLDVPGFWRIWRWFYGKNMRRYFMFREMDEKIRKLGTGVAINGKSINMAQALSAFLSQLLFRRWVRSIKALLLIWLILRYPLRSVKRKKPYV
ncbi:MAG: glycosyltransferase [Alphaproteobacteria bacterium TMED89]|nr:MAG: glycosyltransferase [Alphaproteobacteria bacterium TMED89]